MSQILTWVPDSWTQYNGLPYEDARACSSPRPDFNLNPAAVSKQAQPLKRKHSEVLEPTTKKRKLDSTASHAPKVYQPRPLAPANGPNLVRESATPPSTGNCVPTKPIQVAAVASVAPANSQAFPGSQAPPETSSQMQSAQVLPLIAPQAIRPQQASTPVMLATGSATDSKPLPRATEVVVKNRVIDRIDAHLDLQILEKHDELRLIETEIGKAQIMLEQLRRVRIIPYPSQQRSSTQIEQVITGTGLALQFAPGTHAPKHSAPSGVVDGPYSRHYERWLIPDETFDFQAPRHSRTSVSLPTAVPRKRASADEATPVRAPKRSSTNQIPQLPTVTISVDGTPVLVVQRDDGEWVKVVCKVCGKQNAANLQGFTNHSRIAHAATYANHKEAIKDCGQTLDEHESAQVAAATSAQAQQQFTAQAFMGATTPLRSSRFSLNSLVTTESSRQSTSAQRTLDNLSAADWRHTLPQQTTSTSPKAETSDNGSAFVPSPDTPHLSKLLAAQGSDLDLRQLVASARIRIDLEQVESIAPEVDDCPTPMAPPPARDAPVSRMPARAQTASQVQTSRSIEHKLKQTGNTLMHARPTFAPNASSSEEESPGHSPTTVDTNPGLVSDHDDESDHSEHGDDVRSVRGAGYMDVRVQGEHGYEDEEMHGYHDIHSGDNSTQCTTGPPRADTAIFPEEQPAAEIPQHGPSSVPQSEEVATPIQKKKRGRPRKNDSAVRKQ